MIDVYGGIAIITLVMSYVVMQSIEWNGMEWNGMGLIGVWIAWVASYALGAVLVGVIV